MIDTQEIRLISIEYDPDECRHPYAARWPFKPEWEVCAECGAIVRPADFIPFLAEHLLEVCYDAR